MEERNAPTTTETTSSTATHFRKNEWMKFYANFSNVRALLGPVWDIA
jgi:hypothetical protein